MGFPGQRVAGISACGAVAAIFLLAAIALSGVLPLWLDEITQLHQTKNTTPSQLIASLPTQPGAAPLGYLVQQAALRVTGYSLRWARFPSALFMAGTVLLVGILGAQLGLRRPWLAAAVFALFPLTLRYACESRVYAQALFFSALATVLFVGVAQSPTALRLAAYAIALAAGIYSQTFAVFSGFAHLAWAARGTNRKTTALSAAAITLAVAAYAPWYVYARPYWSANIASAGYQFAFSAKTPLMLLRELIGAGYWGSGLLLILCALATARREKASHAKWFLILLAVVPAFLAVVADGIFGYFVATRQIIWVLPAVALLSCLAIEMAPRMAIPLAVLLATVCIWQSVRYFTAPKEDWELAADTMLAEVRQGACLIVVPANDRYLYEFLRPGLTASRCPASRTILAATPYVTGSQQAAAASDLIAQGYTRQSASEAGKTLISVYSR